MYYNLLKNTSIDKESFHDLLKQFVPVRDLYQLVKWLLNHHNYMVRNIQESFFSNYRNAHHRNSLCKNNLLSKQVV